MSSILLSSLLISPAMAVAPKPGEVLAKDQTIKVNISLAPKTIDPNLVTGTPGLAVARNAFEPLLTYDADGKPLPGVAERYTHSKDSKVWTFYLRKDAKWSNGETVTAHDFVYSWSRIADPKTASGYSSFLEYMKIKNASDVIAGKKPLSELGVKALDDYTFEVTLDSSVSFLDNMAGLGILSPVPKKVVEKYGNQWTRPEHIVSNGAWVVAENTINEKIILKRNPYYWDNKNVVLDKVIMYQISSSNSAFDRYRAGDLDVSGYPTELFKKVQKDYPKELHKLVPNLCTYFFTINTTKKPLDNPKVREALSMALDRQILTDKVIIVGDVPSYTLTPTIINSGEQLKPPSWANMPMAERSKKARELLKEAGYSKSNPLKFSILYTSGELSKKIIVATQSLWKSNLEGAVNVTLKNQEWKAYLDTRTQMNYEMASAGWCADYDDASAVLNIMKSDSSNNDTGYKKREYDALIDKAYAATTDNERQKYYAEAEAMLGRDTPVIPFALNASRPLVKQYVRGLSINKNSRTYYKNVYILKH